MEVGKATINPKSQLGLMKPRLEALQCVLSLIKLSFKDASQDKLWFLDTSLTSSWSSKEHRSLHYSSRWFPSPPLPPKKFKDFTFQSNAKSVAKEDSSTDRYSLQKLEKTLAKDIDKDLDMTELFDRLMPTLMSYFMESSAIVFANETIDGSNALSLMQVSLDTMTFLWRTLRQSGHPLSLSLTEKYIPQITKFVTPRFPFGDRSSFSYRDSHVESTLENANIGYCELTCHFDFILKHQGHNLLKPVIKYLMGFLNPNQGAMTKMISLDSLEKIYPVIWTFLKSNLDKYSSRILALLLKIKSPSDRTNATFKSIFQFMTSILRYQHQSKAMEWSENDKKVLRDWILSFPKKLWETKLHDLKFTRVGYF